MKNYLTGYLCLGLFAITVTTVCYGDSIDAMVLGKIQKDHQSDLKSGAIAKAKSAKSKDAPSKSSAGKPKDVAASTLGAPAPKAISAKKLPAIKPHSHPQPVFAAGLPKRS